MDVSFGETALMTATVAERAFFHELERAMTALENKGPEGRCLRLRSQSPSGLA